MDVTAYTYGTGAQVELGSIAEAIWTNGFKFSEDRAIQVSNPINAPAPNLFDRLTRTENFSFAAGRSFPDLGAALVFFGTHPAQVPALADLQFTQGGQSVWLNYCGIKKIELVEKRGALVIFGYQIIGGAWAANRN